MNAIELRNCTKIIKKATILDDISLSLDSAAIYGFVGVNGSGKTMLLRAIAGMIALNAGTIKVMGETITMDTPPHSMGVVIENATLWPNLTGFQCLEVLAVIKGILQHDDIERALERVGLDPLDKRPYYKYSLGMKQRLAIAQAFMEKPQVILLDEPSNALDRQGVELLHQILRDEKERGSTIVMASHYQQEVEECCDQIFTIEQGRTV